MIVEIYFWKYQVLDTWINKELPIRIYSIYHMSYCKHITNDISNLMKLLVIHGWLHELMQEITGQI